jgi:DNA-binding CsgD family transcriptional regulator
MEADMPNTTVAPSPQGRLTAREQEVLLLVAQGLTNAQIAQRFWISKHTVNVHVGSILGKLGAGNRTQAVSVAVRHGLISYG